MNFNDTIQLQALRLKQLNTEGFSGSSRLVDHLIDQNPEQAQQLEMKNICAMVSKQMFDEVDGICHMLDISKRRFVELALSEAIAKASVIVNEVQPFPEEHA